MLDEPCPELDPFSIVSIEEILLQFKKDDTIILVPHKHHNIQQVSRVADRAGF